VGKHIERSIDTSRQYEKIRKEWSTDISLPYPQINSLPSMAVGTRFHEATKTPPKRPYEPHLQPSPAARLVVGSRRCVWWRVPLSELEVEDARAGFWWRHHGGNAAPAFVPWGSCLERHRAGGRRGERRRAARARAMRPHVYGVRRRAIGRVDAGAVSAKGRSRAGGLAAGTAACLTAASSRPPAQGATPRGRGHGRRRVESGACRLPRRGRGCGRRLHSPSSQRARAEEAADSRCPSVHRGCRRKLTSAGCPCTGEPWALESGTGRYPVLDGGHRRRELRGTSCYAAGSTACTGGAMGDEKMATAFVQQASKQRNWVRRPLGIGFSPFLLIPAIAGVCLLLSR
jgi:hypothetical protein